MYIALGLQLLTSESSGADQQEVPKKRPRPLERSGQLDMIPGDASVASTPPEAQRTGPVSAFSRFPAVFWLGFSFSRGHLGASLDRDFASPGLLGVRWDGPAGGSTWGGPTAGRRPADGGATYVSAPLPLLGAWGAKNSRSVPGTLLVPPGGAGSAPPSGPKNGQGTDV